jgi:hypothetical protein
MTNNNFFPVTINEVPSKAEINIIVSQFAELEKFNPIEKYVILKAYEYFIKESLVRLKTPAINSFLETKQGVTNDFIFGADVKITGERITVKHEKYTYSDVVVDIENKIEKKQNELKLLQDKLKLQKTMEINQNIAKKDIWEEEIEPQYGITVTLRKK